MKAQFRQIFAPVLRPLEEGNGDFRYQPMHRTILLVVAGLFLLLSAVSAYFSLSAGLTAGLLATVVFLTLSATCTVVGLLGTDRAVARLWGNR
ncbi:hypothetical protein [Algiphilus sp.]|uniref:hypothetical protein n=1 Tax=Algiphilus sp. TaxID=1872431 RepID=UPI003B527836